MADVTRCILVRSKEQKMKKCKYCGNVPPVADVGGNNPYYEINCGCGKNTIVGSYDKQEAINTWDAIQR
jgi:hypothetical protein